MPFFCVSFLLFRWLNANDKIRGQIISKCLHLIRWMDFSWLFLLLLTCFVRLFVFVLHQIQLERSLVEFTINFDRWPGN